MSRRCAPLIVVPLAFLYAYALTRTVLPVRWLFQGISLIPIFAPSLLPGLALVYLFGNQGFFKGAAGRARSTASTASSSPRSSTASRTPP